MPPSEAPSSIPSLITQPRSPPPRVDTPAPRVGQATPGVAAPTTPNSHRRLSPIIKTPTTAPTFDLYKQQKQTLCPTPNKTRPPVQQRVVEYLDDTIRHLLADLQAETDIYYKTRSSARQNTANAVIRFIPLGNSAIKAEYATHMANEITHAVTGETLSPRKLLQNPDTQPAWKTGSYNEYGQLFQGHKGVKGTDTCLFIHHSAVPKGRIHTYVKCVQLAATESSTQAR
jgi:hypothetical protein